MKYLDVGVWLPDDLLHPMQAFIRHEDAVRYEELLTWNVQPGAGLEYELFYVEADLERYRGAVESVESIREYRFAPVDETSTHVWACQETRPEDRDWRAAFADRHLVVVPPVRFDADATMGMTLVGEASDLQGVVDDVPPGVEVTVNEVGSYDRRGGTLAGALTRRQFRAVEAALAAGYYEVPREGALGDVAATLDCAESTASELLRRAERTLLSRVVERRGGRAVSGSAGVEPRP